MKTIKESPRLKTMDSETDKDVISYMEKTYPEMTSEFKQIQQEQ